MASPSFEGSSFDMSESNAFRQKLVDTGTVSLVLALPVDHPEQTPDDADMADPITRTELDAKFEAMRADMKAGFSDLRATFAEDRTTNVKWMVGMAVAIVTILGSITTYTAKIASAPAQANAPIVIYAQPPAPAASR